MVEFTQTIVLPDLRTSACPCGSGKSLGECCSTGLWVCGRCGKRFTLEDTEPQACPHCAWRGVHLLRYSGGKPTPEAVAEVKAALQRSA